MKTQKEIKKQIGSLSENEKTRLKEVIITLKDVIADGKVTEVNFKRVTNILSELTVFRENFIIRLFRLFKQNHMVD
jgi:histidinol phosphatase-like enzyme